MKWVTIAKIHEFVHEEVELRGWLVNKRSSGKIHFLQVRDGSGRIQCVMAQHDGTEEDFLAAKGLTQESSLILRGLVRPDARSPRGYELTVSSLQVVGAAEEYPIGKKEHGVGFLMEKRHLWLRHERQTAIQKIRSRLSKYIHDYFQKHGFVLTDTPIFTPSASEGTTTLFPVDYFGDTVYLTQSGQLYGEALAKAMGQVYTFGPTFRSEKSKTRRHLMEFWMVEPEMAFYDLTMNMDLAEDFLVEIVGRLVESSREELDILERNVARLEQVQKPFPRVHYREAWDQLRSLGSDISEGNDFGGDDETLLTEQYDRPIIVHRFPTAIKAFYMKRDESNPVYSLSMDVLAPEGYGEIIGGGAREESLAALQERLAEHGLSERDFDWYLDLRRYGSTPSAGFGMGLERALAWICGIPHVRETIPFPRMLDKYRP